MWMTSILFTLFGGFLALGPVNRLGLPRWAEIGFGLFLIVIPQNYLLIRLFRTSIISPDGVPPLLLLAVFLGSAFLLVATGAEILRLLLFTVKVKLPAWTSLSVGLLGAIFLIVSGFRQPGIVEETLALSRLPAEAEGLRVAVIADLHIDLLRGKRWCERFVSRINAASPDIILFTGDQADGDIDLRKPDMLPLKDLSPDAEKYLITGNHEFYFETEAYLNYYRELGIRPIDSECVTTHGLAILGLPDTRSLTQSHISESYIRMLTRDIPAEMPIILLAHKPAVASIADRYGIEVQFSGHTHGGQLPVMDRLIAQMNAGFVRGWYTLPNGLKLYVSTGAGVWLGFPYRFFQPEVKIFTLKRQIENL